MAGWRRSTVYLVEATACEKQFLWERWSAESRDHTDSRKVRWEQLNPGHMQKVGEVGGKEIWVCVFWARIEGYPVAFYEATSQVVDHELVNRWLASEWPRVHRTDAQNFGNCVDYVRSLNKPKT